MNLAQEHKINTAKTPPTLLHEGAVKLPVSINQWKGMT